MALAVPTSLSPSKVSSFRDCALAFRFSAIDRLPEPPTVPAAKGTVVHRALELLHCLPNADRTPAAAQECLVQAMDDVLSSDEYAPLALAAEQREAFHAEAAELVRRYFGIEDPRTIDAIGMELKLEAEVGGVVLRGIIDRLELGHDGELVVTDYKTGRVPSERFEQGRLGGVHFYAYLCEAVLGRRPAKVQLLYLAKPVAIVAEPSDQSIRGLQKKVGAIWSAVERACEREDFRPNPGRLCDWCSFKAHCPAFGGELPAVAVQPPQPQLLSA